MTDIFLALLNGGIAVRVRDLGGLAQAGGDEAVDEAEDGDGAQGDGNDGAGVAGSVSVGRSRFRMHVPPMTIVGGTCRTGLDDRGNDRALVLTRSSRG